MYDLFFFHCNLLLIECIYGLLRHQTHLIWLNSVWEGNYQTKDVLRLEKKCMSAILIASGYGSLQSNIERGRIMRGKKRPLKRWHSPEAWVIIDGETGNDWNPEKKVNGQRAWCFESHCVKVLTEYRLLCGTKCLLSFLKMACCPCMTYSHSFRELFGLNDKRKRITSTRIQDRHFSLRINTDLFCISPLPPGVPFLSPSNLLFSLFSLAFKY